MKFYRVVLPVKPVSVNRMTTRSRNGYLTFLSKAYKDYKAQIQWEIISHLRHRPTPLEGSVVVLVKLYSISKRGDLDNILKGLLDACQGLLYVNDSQIDKILCEREVDKENQRIEIGVYSLAEWMLEANMVDIATRKERPL